MSNSASLDTNSLANLFEPQVSLPARMLRIQEGQFLPRLVCALWVPKLLLAVGTKINLRLPSSPYLKEMSLNSS
jgi:hypothetical protein